MNSVTVDEVMSWHPCDPPYTREYVEELFAGRATITALDILDMDIPPEDKLWAVLRPELIPDPMLHELACRFAEDVLPLYEERYPNDNRPRKVIETKRRWLRGDATDEELAEAVEVAREAAGKAVAAVALAAAAAWACAAAWGAARAWARAWAWGMAWGARERQVEIVRKLLEES